MKSKKHREMPEFKTIQAAIEGDVEAINQILSYFQPFINSECKRKYVSTLGSDPKVLNMFVLVGAVKTEDRVVREMMGL